MPRFIAQSFAPYRYAREGGLVKTEDDPLDPAPPAGARETNAAMAYLDRVVTQAGGIRFATAASTATPAPAGQGGPQTAVPAHRRRQGLTSWIHLDDAAAATVLALGLDGPALYNIVDDQPAPAREWLPVLADALGAKPPRHIPGWMGRLILGGRGGGRRPVPRRLERQGQAGTALDAPLSQLAAGLRRLIGGGPGPSTPQPDQHSSRRSFR